jgi:peptidoglycan/LPS O-acetylase OafA/YrhL
MRLARIHVHLGQQSLGKRAGVAPSSPHARTRIDLLDGLRVVACLSVVIFHYAFRGAAAHDLTSVSLPGISGAAKYGFLGVQLFFMISGFAIAFSAQGRTAGSFALARLIRIYPGFLICMSVSATLSLVFADPGYVVTWGQWLANLGINAPFFGHGYIDGVYWSLVYEVKFYVLFGALLLLGLAPTWTMPLALVWMLLSAIDYFAHPYWISTAYLITDQSGFFAIGLALYELYRLGAFGDDPDGPLPHSAGERFDRRKGRICLALGNAGSGARCGADRRHASGSPPACAPVRPLSDLS